MSERRRIVVTGCGVLSSLGQLEQSWAAARGQLSRIQDWPSFFLRGPDEEFDLREPMRAAPAAIPWEWAYPWDRVVDLALPAMDEALESAGLGRAELAATRLEVSLRPPVPPRTEEEMAAHVLAGIRRRGSLPRFAEEAARFSGHASAASGLMEAAHALHEDACERALVGGVDTFADIEVMDRLDREFRLKGSRSPDGYAPGEAAAFVVIERDDRAAARGAAPLATIEAVTLAEEPRALGHEKPSAADGLSEVVRAAAKRAKAGALPAWVLSDQNGERHRAREWALVLTRHRPLFEDDVRLWHPADAFGDTGPASLPLLMTMAIASWRNRHAPRDAALVLASSDGPARAGVLLRHAERAAMEA